MARKSTEDRRRQIVEEALALLADQPTGALTTRALAGRVGVSQPALFRHFRSRDAILAAVLDHVRATLSGTAATLLDGGGLERAVALAAALGAQVSQAPGLLRLLAWDLEQVEPARSGGVAGLIAGQRSVVAELVRQAQAAGEVPAGVDARAAGAALVALVQGTLLQWQLEGRPPGATDRTTQAARLWLAGVRAGEPRGEDEGAGTKDREGLVALDVRPLLARGQDPLGAVLAALDRVAADGLLRVTAPFEPRPLIALLEGRGHRVRVWRSAPDRHELDVFGPLAPEPQVLDGLEAPEPLERILAASLGLAAGAAVLGRLPRVPQLLLPRLDQAGLTVAWLQDVDGAAWVHVRRPA